MDTEAINLFYAYQAGREQYFNTNQSSWSRSKASKEMFSYNQKVFNFLLDIMRDKGFCQANGLPAELDDSLEDSFITEHNNPYSMICKQNCYDDEDHVLGCVVYIDAAKIVSKEVAYFVLYKMQTCGARFKVTGAAAAAAAQTMTPSTLTQAVIGEES